tara:strand:- start:1243 stop:2229 length:987 start_codon:yes stop_codon:yes gene_type:complete
MKKVLIFTNGEPIGEGILKLPIVGQLKNRFPNHEIHWMTDQGLCVYGSRLNKYTNNFIDKVWEQANLSPFFWKKISDKFELEDVFFDIVIDTQKAVPRTIALKRIKCGVFISSSARWIFSDIKPKNIKKVRRFYVRNIIDMLDLVSDQVKDEFFKLQIPDEILKKVSTIFNKEKIYLGIAPGSNTPERIWNIKNFISVAKHFENKGIKIVFFLGPAEQKLKNLINSEINSPIFPEDNFPDLDGLDVVMASTKFLNCSIANDSGTSQMLSTNYCPLIKIIGPTQGLKFINDTNDKVEFIESRNYGGTDVNLVPVGEVIKKINQKINLIN